jgi:phosphorylated CTD-interacting factor 1
VDDAERTKFNKRLFCCLKRYDAVGGPTYQCSVTSTTFCTLETAFGAVKECFASPFNHNSNVYWSAFPDTDCFFGSQGDFFEAFNSRLVQEGGVFFANPPFIEEYIERLLEQVQAMLELQAPVTFAVVLPTWTDTECYRWMQTSAFTEMHVVLAAGEYEYIDGRQHVDTRRWRKRHISPFCSTFFILQNDIGRARDDVNDETRRRVMASFSLRRKV